MGKFYFIDKPIDISSFDVIRTLRKKLNTKKIGHTGTLDPLATGWLILAVWNYTKLIPYLEKDKKEYEFDVMLDWTTQSYDLGEEVEYISKEQQEKYRKEITLEKIENVLKERFSWEINQVPPKYSALKINWKKAYELAREWKNVEMKARKITIFDIQVLDYDYPKLTLKAFVSAWTYIRSIAADLWELLWTGAYISRLRRTKIWKLDIDDSQKLDDFDETITLDVKKLFSNLSFIEIDDEVLKKINNWLKVFWEFNYEVGKDLLVYKKWFITNILHYDGEKLIAKRKI